MSVVDLRSHRIRRTVAQRLAAAGPPSSDREVRRRQWIDAAVRLMMAIGAERVKQLEGEHAQIEVQHVQEHR